ncbi:TIGR02757 family protein [Gangjinia marincola]|uniref:TIGR02757 family protein n=1 Tax=Gangjinia marincola TaxID=578463 RepID=A0ABP3XNT9_9FLAO
MKKADLKNFLDQKVEQYNQFSFIAHDPIAIPHRFSKKEDIEISAFLVATIAWGNRKSILTNANKLMSLMDDAPHDFVINHEVNDLEKLSSFVHRTFNGDDLLYFISALKNIYQNHAGLESVFSLKSTSKSTQAAITHFKKIFFELPHLQRTEKHVSDPSKNSAAKRLNMFLRWMVRKDQGSVDFGLWDTIATSALSCPLDVHSGNVARKLGLLKRKQNDGKALTELDKTLRKLDPLDPVKYDFALFGLGVFERF